MPQSTPFFVQFWKLFERKTMNIICIFNHDKTFFQIKSLTLPFYFSLPFSFFIIIFLIVLGYTYTPAFMLSKKNTVASARVGNAFTILFISWPETSSKDPSAWKQGCILNLKSIFWPPPLSCYIFFPQLKFSIMRGEHRRRIFFQPLFLQFCIF